MKKISARKAERQRGEVPEHGAEPYAYLSAKGQMVHGR